MNAPVLCLSGVSRRYYKDFNETRAVGGRTGNNRTDYQNVTPWFWVSQLLQQRPLHVDSTTSHHSKAPPSTLS